MSLDNKLEIALWIINGGAIVIFSLTITIIKAIHERVKSLEEADKNQSKSEGKDLEKLANLKEKYNDINNELRNIIDASNNTYQKKEQCLLIKTNLNEKLKEIKKELIRNNQETKKKVKGITDILQKLEKTVTRIEVEVSQK